VTGSRFDNSVIAKFGFPGGSRELAFLTALASLAGTRRAAATADNMATHSPKWLQAQACWTAPKAGPSGWPPRMVARHNPAVDEIVRAALDAVTDRDWDTVRRVLHPYLHWTLTDGRTLRGRNQVIAMLECGGTLAAPARVELRDGQIYRWHSGPPAR
jgi:hypothetical protein